MNERVVTIPGTPAPELSPNARCHWRIKARLIQQARSRAMWAAFQQHGIVFPLRAPVVLHAVVAWESRRKIMDVTNLIAALKSYEDGLVDAQIMPDDRGVLGWTVEQLRDPDKRGYTVITVTSVEDDPLLSFEELVELIPELEEFEDFACYPVEETR